MSSVNAAGSRLSILLVAIMILPSMLSIGALGAGSSEMAENSESRGVSEFPSYTPLDLNSLDSHDPSYGWEWDKNNIGIASLSQRSAAYVPIQEWTQRTGEEVVTGWHTLGHDYPIPSDWKEELEEMGMECRTFFAPQGLHCNVPKLTPAILMEAGVFGAFRLSSGDKVSVDTVPMLQGFPNHHAVKHGDEYEMLVVLSGEGHLGDLRETGVNILGSQGERFVDIVAGPKEVEMLSNLDFVEWIEHNYPTTLDNEVAAQIIGAEWVSIPSNMLSLGGALTGEGVIVAVMDSGLATAV